MLSLLRKHGEHTFRICCMRLKATTTDKSSPARTPACIKVADGYKWAVSCRCIDARAAIAHDSMLACVASLPDTLCGHLYPEHLNIQFHSRGGFNIAQQLVRTHSHHPRL